MVSLTRKQDRCTKIRHPAFTLNSPKKFKKTEFHSLPLCVSVLISFLCFSALFLFFSSLSFSLSLSLTLPLPLPFLCHPVCTCLSWSFLGLLELGQFGKKLHEHTGPKTLEINIYQIRIEWTQKRTNSDAHCSKMQFVRRRPHLLEAPSKSRCQFATNVNGDTTATCSQCSPRIRTCGHGRCSQCNTRNGCGQ